MVEIKLAALNFDVNDKDTYVAVRVGENQKLSRLSPEKSYKFPKSALGEKGDRKFGKVDIFKKVGTATIGIRHDPQMTHQEIDVPNGNGDGKVNFRVTLAEAEAAPDKGKDSNQHLENAKSYLTDHNLEMLLSDAMQAVLRQRPENPSQFIAARLTNTDGAYRKVGGDGERAQTAPAGANKPAAAAASPAADAVRKSVGALSPEDLKEVMNSMPDEEKAKIRDASKQAQAAPAAGAPDTEALRQQAKQTLLEATANGSLDAALGKVKDSKGGAAAAGEKNEEELRQEAKQALLEAAANGSLDAALMTTASSKVPADGELLRKQAKDAVLMATSDGSLDKSLAGLKASKEGGAATRDTETLRAEAKQTLLAATASGQLDESLSKLKSAKDAEAPAAVRKSVAALSPEDLKEVLESMPDEEKAKLRDASKQAAAEAPAAAVRKSVGALSPEDLKEVLESMPDEEKAKLRDASKQAAAEAPAAPAE